MLRPRGVGSLELLGEKIRELEPGCVEILQLGNWKAQPAWWWELGSQEKMVELES